MPIEGVVADANVLLSAVVGKNGVGQRAGKLNEKTDHTGGFSSED